MIINGNILAKKILAEAKKEIGKLKRPPTLAAVLVDDNSSSRTFVEFKKRAVEEIGGKFKLYEYPASISILQLRKQIEKISRLRFISGILVELPLPGHIDARQVLDAIPKEKDVDALSGGALADFFTNQAKILPPSVEAVKDILSKESLKGKNAAIFGYGLLIGQPIAHYLMQQGATVTVINEFTKSPARFSREADIIISGVGKPNLINGDMIKKGSIIIDFGFNLVDGKIKGDVDFKSASKKAEFITPVPGGAGPIVVAAVIKNLVKLAFAAKV